MPHLIEVWNDTVDSRHLTGGIAISVGIAVTAFLVADHLFAAADQTELGHSYALLIGILGCILGAVITGLLFKPKRVITTSTADTRSRQEIIDEIVEEYGDLGDPRELPEAVQNEVRTLGLFDALLDNHRSHAADDGNGTRKSDDQQ
ncbi:hypothetical protein [Brevibacterium linens]|uniref:Uncharacterized protein n=1 Tax=Brevibacterium linens TaxID=1703 RepID=A0A0B8ZX80_BRELN|nr:hypothetical protein [Brevibacterium linens]KHS51062.1 hypothetical protein AE0388_3134 [Brevibacterium linens]